MKHLLYAALLVAVISCNNEAPAPPSTTTQAAHKSDSGSISYSKNPERFIKTEPAKPAFNITNPKSAQEHFNVGIDADNHKDWNKAIAEYQQALALKPDWAVAHYRIAVDYELVGRVNDAIAHWEQATHYDPQFYSAYNRLASTYRSQGNLKKAIDAYTALLNYPPAKLGAHYELALAYEQLGDRDHAREHFQSYRQLALNGPEKDSPRFQYASNALKKLQ